MRIKAIAIIGFVVGFIIAITSQFCVAIDTPHNESNNVYCGGCHVGPNFLESPYWFPIYTPQTIDDTPFNMLCLSCHVASSGPYTDTSAPKVKTHSSVSIDNKYGNWTRECIHCHKPHKQLQKNYKSTDAGILYLAQGTITSCVYNGDGTSTLTYSSITYKTGWDATKLTKKTGDYRYTVLWPDVNKLDCNYPITAVDSGTITVKGNATTSFSPPTAFAVMYGQYIKDSIEVGGTYKTVKFFDRTGTNSFADGDGTYNGICEVCHTQTTHFRNNGGAPDQNHTDIGGAGGKNCISCHPHSEGFKAGCEGCHDSPPSTCKHAAHFASGTVNFGTTIQSTTGAYAFSCGICHNGTHKNTFPQLPNPHTVEVIFAGVATQDPDSPPPGSATYSPGAFSVDDPSTGWTFNYSNGTCSNTYCHGNYPGSGLNASPTFETGTASCGSCHGASNSANSFPNSGNHEKHVDSDDTIGASTKFVYNREYACTLCHKNITGGSGPSSYSISDKSKHVNGYVDWRFDTNDSRVSASSTYSTATGTAMPSDGTTPRAYGRCNNIYCHSIAQTATGGPLTPNTSDYKTPTWGTTHRCEGCHNEIGAHGGGLLTSGSHRQHTLYTFNIGGQARKCTICHKWKADAVFNDCNQCHRITEKTYHVNGVVDVLFDTYFGNGIFNGTPSPGDGFAGSTCSNTYCHSNGTSVSTGTIPNNTSAIWGSGALACNACHGNPPAYANGSPKTNSHAAHGSNTCNKCHYATTTAGTSITNKANHVNKAYNLQAGSGVSFTYTYAANGGTCSSGYCHGSGIPKWGTTIACDGCHKASNILQGKHSAHYETAAVAASRTAANNSSGTTYAFNCGVCHDPGVTAHAGGAVSGIEAAQIALDATFAGGGTYTAGGVLAGTDNTFNWTAGTCTSTYCHSQGTKFSSPYNAPNVTSFNWNSAAGTLQCNGCHGNTTYTTDYRKGAPLYATGSPKANAHVYHVDAMTTPTGETQCLHCHNATTNNNTTITGSDKHINKAYDLASGTSTFKDGDNVGGGALAVTVNYTSGNPSTCSNASCHPTGLAGTKASSTTKWSNAYSCTDCHKIDMNNTSGYHHVMDSTALSNRTYPTAHGSTAYRKCTMCHVDHDIFSPMLNSNAALTQPRAMNLRTSIGAVPTKSSGFANSDYISGGGICISCHGNSLCLACHAAIGGMPKNNPNQKNDGTTAAMIVTDAQFSTSAHQYNVVSTMSNGGATFNANCSKCHNAKNGETTTFQSSTNKFGTHDNPLRRLFASLGMTSPTDPEEEDFCYRCHSKTTDINPGGGPAKTTANKDYYGVANMSTASEGLFAVFGKTYKHNVAGYSGLHKPLSTEDVHTIANRHVECVDCHNPHAAKQVTHTPPGNTVASTSPITGTWGVEPTFSSPGTPSAGTEVLSTPTYTKVSPITKEYQLCLKCHSSYAYGSSPPSGYTDQGKEFNPYNYCLHPVTGTAGVTQWKNPVIRANYTTLLKAPWNANLDARMYCSDCHGDADSGTPKGPHGSNRKYLLKAWGGVDNGKTRYPNAANSYDDLCLLCHVEAYSGGKSGFESPWSHSSNSAHQYEGENCNSENCLGCAACHGGPSGYVKWSDVTDSGPSNGGRTGAMHGANFYWDNPGTETNNPADHFLVGGYNAGIRLDNYSGGNDGDGRCWSAGLGNNAAPCGSMTGGKTW